MWRGDPLLFTAGNVQQDLEASTPMTWSVLSAATMGRVREQKEKSAIPIIAQVMASILRYRCIRCNTLQFLVALQLWFGGCQREVK